MALRTSWLARPPTAAANGGRVPLAVLDRQRTNSAFTEVWKERREEGKWDVKISVRLQLFFQRGASLQVQEYENMRNGKKKRKALTLFLRVAFTSSVSFSKTSASCKHLMASKWNCSQLNVSHFNNFTHWKPQPVQVISSWKSWITENTAVDWKAKKYFVYLMLGSLPCCSWKVSRANMAAWICRGAWWAGNCLVKLK